MKTQFSLSLLLCLCLHAHGLTKTVETSLAGPITLTCDNPGKWEFDMNVDKLGDKEVLTVRMNAPSPQLPPQFDLSFSLPQIDAHHLWCDQNSDRCQLKPDWGVNFRTNIATELPLYAFINNNSTNRLTVASSECLRDVNALMGLREEGCVLKGRLNYFSGPQSPIDSYETKVMFDRRPVFFGDAVREAVAWMTDESGFKPVEAPAAAFDPLYSSWYQFHQNVSDKAIEAECREAARLGMKTLIVDDGWQTDDNNRGYAFTGDWEVSKNRFSDMASHVAKVKEMGMRYLVWYSVPFIGKKSRNYERFKGKYLWEDHEKGALDPRFPDVREFLINLFDDHMRRYGYDGYKLDFIDCFNTGNDPAIAENFAGRDIKVLSEAVDVLMKGIYSRLKAIKPDVLIEFRQAYVGPAIRQYGNMLRAGDCPGDMQGNRTRIANLRLISGNTAVHADMLEWNIADSPENAARHILSALFGVVQYSMMLSELPEDHKRVVKHWLDFSQKHRNTLMHSDFRPYHPEAGYPVIEAEAADERIMAVYQDNTIADLGEIDKPTYLINASGTQGIVADFGKVRSADIYNVYGERVMTQKLTKGLQRLSIPSSGYAVIR